MPCQKLYQRVTRTTSYTVILTEEYQPLALVRSSAFITQYCAHVVCVLYYVLNVLLTLIFIQYHVGLYHDLTMYHSCILCLSNLHTVSIILYYSGSFIYSNSSI